MLEPPLGRRPGRTTRAVWLGVPDDELKSLAVRALEGERRAQQALARKLAPRVLSTARKIVWNPAEAEEVAQEAMLTFARDFPSLREPGAVVAFALRITTRLAIRNREQHRRDQSVRAQLQTESPLPQAPNHDEAQTALRVLELLPDEQSETLILHYYEGLTVAEIAGSMGVSPNTVKSRLRLARQTLSGLLRPTQEATG